jgi:hypothetical protein
MLFLRARHAVAGAAVALAGCSFVLDTGDLPANPPDAMPLVDADPSRLSLGSPEPALIDEAVGTGGGRPAVIYLPAPNLVASATVAIAWEDTTLPVDEPVPELVESAASGRRQAIGLVVRVPELPALAEGATRRVLVTVTQPAGGDVVTQTTTFDVAGHDPLVAGAALDTGALDPARLYSSIAFPVNTRATGDRPLVLRSVGPVTVDAEVDVSGRGAANGAAGNGAGAGGCAGGAGADDPLLGGQGQSGACGDGGGGGGPTEIDGGGGGFGSDGDGDIGGDSQGNAMLVPLAAQPDGVNHGNGGGGGGADSVTGAGGDGGHGGGVVAIFAGGSIAIGANGRFLANGGNGTSSANGGAGGGGSGGGVLLHSAVAITGGAGVVARAAAGTSSGGNAGGVGRIRIDVPSGTLNASPTPTYGPAWEANAPAIVRGDGTVSIGASATNGCFGMRLENAALAVTDPGCGNALDRSLPGDVPLRLSADGLNRVCARWTTTDGAGGVTAGPETETCIDLVYLPE